MGSLPNHRLSRSQILGHCRTLCIALTEQKLKNIKLALKEKKFTRDLVFAAKTLAILLGMSLVTELGALGFTHHFNWPKFLNSVRCIREVQRSHNKVEPRDERYACIDSRF